MTGIGQPTADEPLEVPVTWEYPEPLRENAPAPVEPERVPEKVPANT